MFLFDDVIEGTYNDIYLKITEIRVGAKAVHAGTFFIYLSFVVLFFAVSFIPLFAIFSVTFIPINVMGNFKIEGGILPVLLFLIMVISLLGMFFYPLILIVSYAVYSIKNQNCPYVRTEKGEEINKKLEGLKIYLKEYSYLEEKKESEIVIWEEYLVYSVLFNQNTKIIEAYKKYIEID